MALTDEAVSPAPDDVEEVAWNLESLVDGKGAAGVDELLDRAETMLPALLEHRGRVATMDAADARGLHVVVERPSGADRQGGLVCRPQVRGRHE